jgi:predicted permease
MTPPRAAVWLVRRFAGARHGADVLADLADEFAQVAARKGRRAAARWYWRQALTSAWPFMLAGASRRRGAAHHFAMARFGSWLDWKLGARMLLKYPGLSLVGGLTIAATIGLGAAWFEVTQQLARPSLPFVDGDRIVRVDLWDAAAARIEPRVVYDFQLWREQLGSIQELGAFRSADRNLITPDGSALPVTVAEISPSAFALTRVAPLLGRILVDSDAPAGAPDVVVVGHDIWMRLFGGDRDVLGRTVSVGRTPATIVGVMPEGFRFPVSHQLWMPLRVEPASPRAGPGVFVFGRLADGTTYESAQAELRALGGRIAAANPATHARLMPRVSPFASSGPAFGASRLLPLTNVLPWLLLAVACANVSTLTFARTATRETELLVRNALGASRFRIMMQLFVEALVLCAVAAFAGVIAANFLLSYITSLLLVMAADLPFWWQFRIGPVTVVYAALLAFAAAAVVGVLPAIGATGPRLQAALARMTSGASIRFGGAWSVLIVLQVMFAALCLPLGLSIAMNALEKDAPSSFPAAEYLTFRAVLDRDVGLATPGAAGASFRDRALRVFADLERRLEAEPSVSAVTFADGLPGTGYPLDRLVVQRESGPPALIDAQIDGDRVWVAKVDIGFFEAFRMPRVAGRAFQPGDEGAQTHPVIVNETLARNIGGPPLGARLRDADAPDGPWREVVGVVRSSESMGEGDVMFVPASAADVSPALIAVHVRGDTAAFAPRLRGIAAQVDPGLRVYDLMPLDEAQRRRDPVAVPAMVTIVAITLLALALSAAGLYSLMSVAVTRRTREIGIRIALGASPRAVLAALFARAATQLGLGILAGVLLCPPLMAALGDQEPLRKMVPPMVAASGCMMLVGLIACGVPARRALRVEVIDAVRQGV